MRESLRPIDQDDIRMLPDTIEHDGLLECVGVAAILTVPETLDWSASPGSNPNLMSAEATGSDATFNRVHDACVSIAATSFEPWPVTVQLRANGPVA